MQRIKFLRKFSDFVLKISSIQCSLLTVHLTAEVIFLLFQVCIRTERKGDIKHGTKWSCKNTGRYREPETRV